MFLQLASRIRTAVKKPHANSQFAGFAFHSFIHSFKSFQNAICHSCRLQPITKRKVENPQVTTLSRDENLKMDIGAAEWLEQVCCRLQTEPEFTTASLTQFRDREDAYDIVATVLAELHQLSPVTQFQCVRTSTLPICLVT